MKKNTKKKNNNSSKKALNIDEIGNIDDVFYRKIKKIKIKIKIKINININIKIKIKIKIKVKILNNRESTKGGEEKRGEEMRKKRP